MKNLVIIIIAIIVVVVVIMFTTFVAFGCTSTIRKTAKFWCEEKVILQFNDVDYLITSSQLFGTIEKIENYTTEYYYIIFLDCCNNIKYEYVVQIVYDSTTLGKFAGVKYVAEDDIIEIEINKI